MYFTSLSCQGNTNFIFYYNFIIVLLVVKDNNTGVDASLNVHEWKWDCDGQMHIEISQRRVLTQSVLTQSVNTVFNRAFCHQELPADWSTAKIKSVEQASNPHSLIYIPKKLNETSRQRAFIST